MQPVLDGRRGSTEYALQLAVELWARRPSSNLDDDVERTALRFARIFSAPPARLNLRPAPTTFEQGPPGPGTPTKLLGGDMAVSLTDTQQVTYGCEPEDSKGFPVSDALTWSANDGGTVVTVTPSDDGLSCVFAAVAPGQTTVTVSDGNLSASDIVTVTAGAVAQLVLAPGAVEDQAPAAPPADAAPAE